MSTDETSETRNTQLHTRSGRSKLRAWHVLAGIGLVVAALFASSSMVGATNQSTISFDVAEDPSRFFFEGDAVIRGGELDGLPAYGDGFITEGFLYAPGTLSADDPGVECEFGPDGFPISCEPLYEVIGTWTCWGHHIGDGAATAEGDEIVVTTQVFEIYRDDGGVETIVTNGFEKAGVGVEDYRAVTGGTGDYTTARGSQFQVGLGLHPEYFNIRLHESFSIFH